MTKRKGDLLTRTQAIALIMRTPKIERFNCSFCGENEPSRICEAPRCPLLVRIQLKGNER